VPVGCDHQLNVTAQRDHCGVWCGDGSSCIQFSGAYSIREHSGLRLDNITSKMIYHQGRGASLNEHA